MLDIEQVRKICNTVTETKLESLRIEEEILINYIRTKKAKLHDKNKALKRIELINREQLAMLGHIIKGV